MPLEVTQTQTTEVELNTAIKEHLIGTLDTIKELVFQVEAINHQIDIEYLTVQSILEDAGVKKLNVNGTPISIVEGTTSRLDKKKLIAQGITQAMIEAATTTKPKKPYLLIGKEKDISGD